VIRAGKQLPLPLASSREYAFARTQLPFPIAPRLVSRAVRRELKSIPKRFGMSMLPAEVWNARAWAEQLAVIEQVRKTARCRSRNATGRNSAAGLAAYVATPEGMRVERAIRNLEKQL